MTSIQVDEESIFHVARQLESPELRSAYLNQVCGDDSALLARIEALLAVHEQDRAYLASPAARIEVTDVCLPAPDNVGSQIGPYKLREQIGDGGMGQVYLAEQLKPIKRKVALKIIRPGMATKDVVARFKAERQALAMMDHPNIARVFDGGVTDAGQPYFVMELVQGVPITEYCDKVRLDTRQRLDLFVKVCRAVHHAHQKGIIHRDLKPSNILVPEIDGAAVPKVIDFGVAKAIDQKLTEQTVYTQFAQLVGTPLYMSPEQAGRGVVDIDIRSDVYSLGILLYELLTGSTPFARETLQRADYDELRRIIREEQPSRPSVMVSTLAAEALATVVERRRSDPHAFAGLLRGELDWLVMKALEKDRNRRYESVAALAEDIGRYLFDEPVLARPPSRLYQFSKFVRRNRTFVASLALVFTALALGATLAMAGFWDAVRQRDLARQRLDEVTQAKEATEKALSLFGDVFSTGWGKAVESQRLTVRESMEKLAERLPETFADHPEIEIVIRQRFASNYRGTGDHANARMHLERALNLAKTLYGEQHEVVADLYISLADELQWDEEEPTDWRILGEYAKQALEIHRQLGLSNDQTGHALYCLSLSLTEPSEQEEAEHYLREALRIAQGLSDTKKADQLVFAILDLANHLSTSTPADPQDAHQLYESALEQSRKLPRDQRALTATVLACQGRAYRRQGGQEGAEGAIRCFEQAWSIYSRPDLLRETRGHTYALDLAELYLVTGHRDKSAVVVAQVEKICRENELDESWADLYLFKGWSHALREDFFAAESNLTKSLHHAQNAFPERHPLLAYTRFYLAEALRQQGKHDQAQDYYRQVTPITSSYIHMPQVLVVPYYVHAMSLIYSDPSKQGMEMALAVATEAHQLVADWPRPSPWVEPHLYLAMAIPRYRLGDTDAAIDLLREGLAKSDSFPSLRATRTHPDGGYGNKIPISRHELELVLAAYVAERDGFDAAVAVYLDGIQFRQERLGHDHLQVALAKMRLGEFLFQHGKFDEASSQLEAAYEKLATDPNAADASRAHAAERMVAICEATQRPTEAAAWQKKVSAHRQSSSASRAE